MPFVNSAGFLPILYFLPHVAFLLFFSNLRLSLIQIAFFVFALILNISSGNISFSLFAVLLNIFMIFQVTQSKFVDKLVLNNIDRNLIFTFFAISLVISIFFESMWNTPRFFDRLRLYTPEASYLAILCFMLFLVFKSKFFRFLKAFIILLTQSYSIVVFILLSIFRKQSTFILLISLISIFSLIFFYWEQAINETIFLSNSITARFIGLSAVSKVDFFSFVLGTGIGTTDQFVYEILKQYQVFEGIGGAFIFGTIFDLGFLLFAILMISISSSNFIRLGFFVLLSNFGLGSTFIPLALVMLNYYENEENKK